MGAAGASGGDAAGAAAVRPDAGRNDADQATAPVFTVSLDNYSGPFDALLSMISRRQLDLTEVALGEVTGEFLAFVRTLDMRDDMDQASGFLDVASVLVEAKSAALLPDTGSDLPDEHNLEALRERDLLFARLLQYRAFKQAGADFRMRIEDNAGWFAHPATVDPEVAERLPELAWTLDAEGLARLAARALANAPRRTVSVEQLHVPPADLREQSRLVMRALSAAPDGEATFDELTADAADSAEVVARFLALLAFFKQGFVRFRQDGPYGTLRLKWVGGAAEPDNAGGAGDAAAGGVPDMVRALIPDTELSEEDFA